MEDDSAARHRSHVSARSRAVLDRLAGAGLEPADIDSRAALVERACVAFAQETGRRPAWGWIVPGRIEVFGKHTDYAGGRSLVAAVPRGFALLAGPRDDGRVRAYDARWDARMEVQPPHDARSFTGWANYVAVVARRLVRNFPDAAFGTDIVFASDLPRAAGLSSSSALVVGVATAIARRAGLPDREDWKAAMPDTLALAGYLGAVENGLAFGPFDVTSGVGTHGGSEDHTAILASRANRVSAFSYVPVRAQGDSAFPDAWRFVVMASGIEADKAGSAKVRYNRASRATQALMAVWRRHTGTTGTLARLLEAPGAVDELRRMTGLGREGDFAPAELMRRLDHFVAEDARIPLALDAIARTDRTQLGNLAAASQREADELLGNQIPQTVTLARLATEQGAIGASSFGAGFGGSVWAIADAQEALAFARRWRDAYLAALPTIPDVAWFVARPAPAVTELPVSES
jgi:galactokinase